MTPYSASKYSSNLKSNFKLNHKSLKKRNIHEIDYLQEIRVNRLAKEEKHGSNRKNTYENSIDILMKDKSLTDYERMEAIKRKAKQLEEQAHMKEILIKNNA